MSLTYMSDIGSHNKHYVKSSTYTQVIHNYQQGPTPQISWMDYETPRGRGYEGVNLVYSFLPSVQKIQSNLIPTTSTIKDYNNKLNETNNAPIEINKENNNYPKLSSNSILKEIKYVDTQ